MKVKPTGTPRGSGSDAPVRFGILKEIGFRLIGVIGSLLIQLLGCTFKVKEYPSPKAQCYRDERGNVIYAFWHAVQLIPAFTHRNLGIAILISQHTDGEYIARIVKRLGFQPVRGSTTRGGARGIIGLIRKAREGADLAITIDGPRGPRHVVQPGVIYLAQKTGLPIVSGVAHISHYWEINSWDRFLIPKPFSKIFIKYNPPIYIPPSASSSDLEKYRSQLETTLKESQRDVENCLSPTNSSSLRNPRNSLKSAYDEMSE